MMSGVLMTAPLACKVIKKLIFIDMTTFIKMTDEVVNTTEICRLVKIPNVLILPQCHNTGG